MVSEITPYEFTENEIEDIIKNSCSLEGNFMDWIMAIWTLARECSWHYCKSRVEVLIAYEFIYQMCALYAGFTNALHGKDPEDVDINLNIDYDLLINSENFILTRTIKKYIKELISNDGFVMLRLYLCDTGIEKTFSSLYYCVNYDKFPEDMSEDEIQSEILDSIDYESNDAYRWLNEVIF